LNQNSVEPLNSDRQTLKKKGSLARFSGGCWKSTTKFCQKDRSGWTEWAQRLSSLISVIMNYLILKQTVRSIWFVP